jgi:hypothetical protein
MHALSEENIVLKFALTCEILDPARTSFEPCLSFLWQAVKRGGEIVICDELQTKALESEQDRSEGPRHDRAALVGPAQLERMRAEFFEYALHVAGDAQGLYGLVRLQQFRRAQNFGGLSGAGHQHDLFGPNTTHSFFRGKEEL